MMVVNEGAPAIGVAIEPTGSLAPAEGEPIAFKRPNEFSYRRIAELLDQVGWDHTPRVIVIAGASTTVTPSLGGTCSPTSIISSR